MRFWRQIVSWAICDFMPDNYGDLTIVVTAPPGTVHEAFFDPATTTAGRRVPGYDVDVDGGAGAGGGSR